MIASWLSRGRHEFIIFDLLARSTLPRDLDTDEPYPLPFAVSPHRKWIPHPLNAATDENAFFFL